MPLSQEHHGCARAPLIVSRSKADLRCCLRMGTHDDDADALVPYTLYTRKASNASACVAWVCIGRGVACFARAFHSGRVASPLKASRACGIACFGVTWYC